MATSCRSPTLTATSTVILSRHPHCQRWPVVRFERIVRAPSPGSHPTIAEEACIGRRIGCGPAAASCANKPDLRLFGARPQLRSREGFAGVMRRSAAPSPGARPAWPICRSGTSSPDVFARHPPGGYRCSARPGGPASIHPRAAELPYPAVVVPAALTVGGITSNLSAQLDSAYELQPRY